MTDSAGADPADLPRTQSTVQLFEQLRDRSLLAPDLHRLRIACTAALELFAGRMHPTGKPYIAHCTGAAGILCALGAEPDVIVAGLLHGAYMWGDFGAGRVLMPLKRRHLRRRVGARAEHYIHAFSTLAWNPEAVGRLVGTLATREPEQRTVVLMRLASELDNIRQRSLLYRRDAESACESLRVKGPLMATLADELGFPALSRALASSVAATLTALAVAPELRNRLGAHALLVPASSRLRLAARLANATIEPLRALRRTLRG